LRIAYCVGAGWRYCNRLPLVLCISQQGFVALAGDSNAERREGGNGGAVSIQLADCILPGYTTRMRFEWDEQKNRANIRKHGFSFADAWEIFDAPMLVDLDDRFDYGEDRWIGIGTLRSRIVVVVYTEPDEDTTRIISPRKALNHERRAHEQTFGN
jgi:uncharacterized DUF497 family protein